jgi:hypothetical protein
MSLVKWDKKLEPHMRQHHTPGSLFEKGGCLKKCVAGAIVLAFARKIK